MFKFAHNIFKNSNKYLNETFTVTREFKTKGEYFRRLGYKYQNIYKGGLLPRLDSKEDSEPLPLPEYTKSDRWSVKKSTFGQNDYIDILGYRELSKQYIYKCLNNI
jgi:hypothetical protein